VENNFFFGFGDELTKLAVLTRQTEFPYDKPGAAPKKSPRSPERFGKGGVVSRTEAGKALSPKFLPKDLPRAPVARKPIPKAEGVVPGTTVSGLPKHVMKGSPKSIISEVGSRRKWEAKTRKQLPGWLATAMKRPVKGHPLAAPGVAEKERAGARKLVGEYIPSPKKKPRRGRRRMAKLDPGLMRRITHGPRRAGRPTGGQMRKMLGPSSPQAAISKATVRAQQAAKAKRKPMPGWQPGLGSAIKRPSRYFPGMMVRPGGTVVPRRGT
jgi:hypothetical protein